MAEVKSEAKTSAFFIIEFPVVTDTEVGSQPNWRLLIHKPLQFCLGPFEPGFLLLDDFHITVLTRRFQMVLSAPNFSFGFLDGFFVVILYRRFATVTLDIGQRLLQAGLAINIIRCVGALYLSDKFSTARRATLTRVGE
ncbi:hypothetical protein PS624_00770 [Pseudomonas fluorescens]|uniref:Uncharacterized protein n=1 Tax=Pseudomonas fluorescens TaxID=294 RepID=A0A5E6Q564_PSEFL|nr:hypothetical protein PS624_00770 [Pseudomonas fluorescens]VVQ27541.1 hypothetical protein PS947_00442 [Pseudomonas fluorescens]